MTIRGSNKQLGRVGGGRGRRRAEGEGGGGSSQVHSVSKSNTVSTVNVLYFWPGQGDLFPPPPSPSLPINFQAFVKIDE